MTSQDVIHSFFVPAFRMKQDVLPDRYTDLLFTPTSPGIIRLFCAEFCGTDHSRMTGRVIVMTPGDYARVAAAAAARPTSRRARARRCSARSAASGCHGGAPACTRRPGRALRPAGAPCRRPRRHRRRRLSPRLDPASRARDVVAGYHPIMPTYRGAWSTRRARQRSIAYLKSLRRREGRQRDDRHRRRRALPGRGRRRSYLDDGPHAWLLAAHHRPQAHRDPLCARRSPSSSSSAASPRRSIRLELFTPQADLVIDGHLQPAVHAARRGHGVVLPGAVDPDHARQFPAAADDRREGRRLSAAQPDVAGTSSSSARPSRSTR